MSDSTLEEPNVCKNCGATGENDLTRGLADPMPDGWNVIHIFGNDGTVNDSVHCRICVSVVMQALAISRAAAQADEKARRKARNQIRRSQLLNSTEDPPPAVFMKSQRIDLADDDIWDVPPETLSEDQIQDLKALFRDPEVREEIQQQIEDAVVAVGTGLVSMESVGIPHEADAETKKWVKDMVDLGREEEFKYPTDER